MGSKRAIPDPVRTRKGGQHESGASVLCASRGSSLRPPACTRSCSPAAGRRRANPPRGRGTQADRYLPARWLLSPTSASSVPVREHHSRDSVGPAAGSRPVCCAHRSTLLQRHTVERPSLPSGLGNPGPLTSAYTRCDEMPVARRWRPRSRARSANSTRTTQLKDSRELGPSAVRGREATGANPRAPRRGRR
jgi:hypothetical protein